MGVEVNVSDAVVGRFGSGRSERGFPGWKELHFRLAPVEAACRSSRPTTQEGNDSCKAIAPNCAQQRTSICAGQNLVVTMGQALQLESKETIAAELCRRG